MTGTAIVFIIRNMITILIHTTLLSHALSYIIFTHFVCDRIRCIGSAFMWSSCGDTWCTPRCTQCDSVYLLYLYKIYEVYKNIFILVLYSISEMSNALVWDQHPKTNSTSMQCSNLNYSISVNRFILHCIYDRLYVSRKFSVLTRICLL